MFNSRAVLGLIVICAVVIFVILQQRNSEKTHPTNPIALNAVQAKGEHDTHIATIQTEEIEALPEIVKPAPTSPVPKRFLEALRECAPEREGTATQLENLLVSLESEAPREKDIQWRNYQMTWSDQTERRVMVIPAAQSGTGKAWEIRFFKVDSEGLPEVEALPENVNGPEDLSRLLSLGEVHTQNEAYHVALNDSEQLMIERRNGKIVDFQWRRAEASMLCSVERCTCLHP